MIELLRAVKRRLTLVKEFDDVPITIATHARFNKLVEGKPEVIISPTTILHEYEARDIVRENLTVSVAVAEYFADKFDDDDVYNILAYVPTIERAFLGVDLKAGDALYRWTSSNALATPFNETVKDIPGGVLDVEAADAEYVYQVPVLLTYTRYLKATKNPSVTIHDLPSLRSDAPDSIVADDALRLSFAIVTDDGVDATASLYADGVLSFA